MAQCGATMSAVPLIADMSAVTSLEFQAAETYRPVPVHGFEGDGIPAEVLDERTHAEW